LGWIVVPLAFVYFQTKAPIDLSTAKRKFKNVFDVFFFFFMRTERFDDDWSHFFFFNLNLPSTFFKKKDAIFLGRFWVEN
jgi:hypothetical protein